MITKARSIVAVAALATCAPLAVLAQTPPKEPGGNLDLTMVLLPENAKVPDAITRRIELPPPVTTPNHGAAAEGKRPDGVGEGNDTAAEARERGRDFGRDVAEQARDNRENAGRGQKADKPDKPDPPGPPPAPPGKPTTP